MLNCPLAVSLSVQSDYKRVLALKCVGPLNSLVVVCVRITCGCLCTLQINQHSLLNSHFPFIFRAQVSRIRALQDVNEHPEWSFLSVFSLLLKKESLNPPSLRRDLIRYCSINKWWVVVEEED